MGFGVHYLLRGLVSLKKEPISNPDPSNIDPSYWEKVLSSHNLSMERASRPSVRLGTRAQRREGFNFRQERVASVGNSQDLVSIEEQQTRIHVRGGKRIEPSGHPPD